MTLRDSDLAELRQCEEDLLRPEVRASRETLDRLIAEEFREFGVSGGVWDKRSVLDSAEQLPDVEVPVTDFHAEELSPSVALVTYRSVTHSAGGGATHALRSSVWVRSDDSWRIVFHQGTRTQ